jgi:hypothetical protein
MGSSKSRSFWKLACGNSVLLCPRKMLSNQTKNCKAHLYSLSISMEHFPEGIGSVFLFFPNMLIVK